MERRERVFFMKFLGDFLAASVLLTCGAWFSVTSELFVRIDAVEVQGQDVSVLRELPYGAVRVRHVEVLRPLAQGHPANVPCENSQAASVLPADGGVAELVWVSWSIADWAEPCMAADFVWQAKWVVYLFGLIPLRPTRAEILVQI